MNKSRKHRLLPFLLGLILLAAAACGPRTRSAGFDAALEWANLEKQVTDLKTLRAQAEDLKAKIGKWEQEKRAPGTFKPEELPDRSPELLRSQLDSMEGTRIKGAVTAFWDNLTLFLNRALNNPKLRELPETKQALRLYADESIALARQAVEREANYEHALALLRQAQNYEKDYKALADEIARMTELRFLSRKRFDAATQEMGMADVRALCGVPDPARVREKPEKGRTLTAWFYPKEGGGTAAFFFQDGRLYEKQWDAQKAP
jgi:hypothetical protein